MKNRLIALAAAVVALVPLTAGTASATATGSLAFECTASLPAFPATSGSGTCSGGAAPAVAGGVVAGVTNNDNQPYTLYGAGSFSASFDYSEGCFLNEPPAIGTASGSATVTISATVGGQTTTATVTVEFTWTRVGVTAAITTGPARISFGTGHTATAAAPGAATAAFAPLLGVNNTCPSGGPLTAVVAGALISGA